MKNHILTFLILLLLPAGVVAKEAGNIEVRPNATLTVYGTLDAQGAVVGIDKNDVDLDQVDNTRHLDKPISTATQTALDGKSDTGHGHAGTYEPADSAIQAHITGDGSDHGDVAANTLKLSGIEDGATADQVASEVPFTPDGSIEATDVQAAIEEVRNEGSPPETDPIYTAWDKSYSDLINTPTIVDWTLASQGIIHATNYVDNDTQLTDGEIGAFGYIKTHTETDPVFIAWDKDYLDLINLPTTITPTQSSKLDGIEAGATTDQNIFETVAGNSGTVTASTPITTINIVGASGVTTAITGSTLTITVDAYVAGAFVRPGHAGGQIAYGGTGAGDDCEIYSTSNAGKGSILIGQDTDSGVEVNEATGETVITGTLIIK